MVPPVYISRPFYLIAMRCPYVSPVFFLLALLLTGARARAQSAATGQEGAAGISNLRDLTSGTPAVLPTDSAKARWARLTPIRAGCRPSFA